MQANVKATLLYVTNRVWLILTIYGISLLVAAALFGLFEDKSFYDGLWWAIVSALTIGYGDLAPATAGGRIMGVIFGHFWIFIVIPMIIANIIFNLIEDKNAFTDEEQREMMLHLRNIEERALK